MYKVIYGIFTDRKLSPFETARMNKLAYIIEGEIPEVGDLIDIPWKEKKFQITEIKNSNSAYIKGVKLKTINMNTKNSSSMMQGVFEKYKSQFIPERVYNTRMTLDGTVAVVVGDEYVGIKNGELISYPEQMTFNVPLYAITKPQSNVQIGDIIVNGKSYAQVIGHTEDGSLKILSYTGYTHTKKEVKDFMMGQATVRCLINMIQTTNEGFNPLMFAMMDTDFDPKTLMMMGMMPGCGEQMKNFLQSPMFMMSMMMGKNSGGDNSMLEAMMMSQFMQGGNNPFAAMFGQQQPMEKSTPEPPKTVDPEVAVLKDLLANDDSFREAFALAIKRKAEENK